MFNLSFPQKTQSRFYVISYSVTPMTSEDLSFPSPFPWLRSTEFLFAGGLTFDRLLVGSAFSRETFLLFDPADLLVRSLPCLISRPESTFMWKLLVQPLLLFSIFFLYIVSGVLANLSRAKYPPSWCFLFGKRALYIRRLSPTLRSPHGSFPPFDSSLISVNYNREL